uniref:UPAR/Ly6 domain-containing protein n=1 Tax=Leptobrachium leishanense TaxID=445787 RepID=A0A8C5QSE4_9ANUR
MCSAGGVETTKSYTRECFLQKQCTVEAYMSVIANVKSQIGTSCCDTDGCTPPLPKLPAGSTRPNGLVCRTCVSTNSDWCDTYDTVQCSGDETMCILGTTITTGHSLSCTMCLEIGANTCDGPKTTCPPDHMCGAMYSLVSIRGVGTTQGYTRECFLPNQCNIEGYMSILAKVKSQIGTSCCDTDGCTPPLPKLPAVSTKLNGLVCRGCFSTDSDWCDTDSAVQCSGNETMCLLETTITTGARSEKGAVRGCATESLCDIGSHSVDFGNKKITSRYNCTSGIPGLNGRIPGLHSGIPGLHVGSILSFSVAISLTKLTS